MSNLIQIKRSENTAVPGSLANGELAFSGNGDILFIGNFGSVTPLAGARTPGTLTANQALVANSTSGIDKVIVANAVITTITANGSVGTAGQVLVSNGSVSYWDDPAASDFTLAADSGSSDTFSTGSTLTFTGGNGVNTAVTDDTITISATAGDGIASNATGVHVVAGNSQVVANSTGVFIDESNINHDNLSGFESNEHVDHSSVTLTAGNGLSGGGDITASRSFAVTAGDGVASNSTGVHVVAGNNQVVANSTGVFIDETNIDIHNLSGYVANENIDHSTVSVTAGNGLTGGGDLTATRDFAVGAGDGITVNAEDVAVTAGDGIVANSTGTHVNAGTGVVANSTGVHIGQAVGTGDNVTFNDITATGNLNVTGTLTTIDTTNLVVQDPLIKLANGNISSDALDIGFFGVYDTSGSQDLYAGLFRDATDGKFKLFVDNQAAPTTTVDTGGTGYTVATLVAALESSSATITGGTITGITDLAVADGGTGASSFTDNGIIYGNGASALSVTSAGTEGQVLMAGSGGVPEFNTLDGGTF